MGSYIGLLEITGRVGFSASLKDKRRVVQSILDRVRRKYNLSVSEVGHQDDRQWTKLSMVGVGSSQRVVEKELRRVLCLIEQEGELEITQSDITFL